MTSAKKIAAVAGVAVAICCAAASAADLKDPSQIIQKSREHALSLDSYSYHILGEGWDLNPEDIAKRTASTASDASKQFKKVESIAGDIKEDAESSEADKPVFRKFETEYKFKKPYLIQMRVVMSDYVPAIIFGSLMTYRPDNDPDIWWFKPKQLPFAVKRDIDSETGDLLYSVVSFNYAVIEALTACAEPSLRGMEKMGEKEAYAIEFKLEKECGPAKVDFEKWGIPAVAQAIFEREANFILGPPHGKFVFYFDKESLLIVGRETFDFDGKLLERKQWKDIKTNNLTEKDF